MPTAPATVLGANGFIGSHLAAELATRGFNVSAPSRDADLTGRDLGVVYYCIGVTADFRARPLDTGEAHAGKLIDVLRLCRFEKLVYLSSTRVYRPHVPVAREDDPLAVRPTEGDDLYNISKLLGESLALHGGRDCVVVRLSNVFGPDFTSDTFLPSLITAALRDGVIRLRSALDSSKDYVSLQDVMELLIRISSGRRRVYNVASGSNVTHAAIVDELARLTGCRVEVAPGAAATTFPPIAIARIQEEFGFTPRSLITALPELVDNYRRNQREWLSPGQSRDRANRSAA